MRLSLLSAKNPMDRLLGDQNGYVAPSVPGRACAFTESSARKNNCVRRSLEPTKTSLRPSGDTAIEVASVVGGVTTWKCTSAGSERLRSRTRRTANATRALAARATTALVAHSRRLCVVATSRFAAALTVGAVSAASISNRRSPTAYQRRLEFFSSDR